jgi:hypothetical protein
MWNTAMIRRPVQNKPPEETPAAPSVDEIPGMVVMLDEEPSSDPLPAATKPAADRPVPAAPARREEVPAAPKDAVHPALHRTTGGLSALVNLWNTAATMRPFRRKEGEAKSSDPTASPVLGMEEIPDEPSPSNPKAPAQEGQGQGRSPGQAPRARARPSPARPPEPKPASAPDETEQLGGWLRGLAGRMRGKPK